MKIKVSMKNLFLILILSFTTQIMYAQIQLEHTYPEGKLRRVRLDVSGETYVLNTFDNINGVAFHIFDSLHTDLGISIIAIEPNSVLYLANPSVFLSQKILDEDIEIELIYSWGYSGEDVFGTSSVQETGEQDYFHCSGFSIIDGLASKLICGSKVYGLPEFQLEHDFEDFTTVQRMKFPVGGERFITSILYQNNFNGFHIHDSNHIWLSTFNFPFDNFKSFKNFTQQVFNDDALLEVYGTKVASTPDANVNDHHFQIAQEDGTVLLTEQCSTGIVSLLPSLPAKVLIYQYVAPGQMTTKVLDAKTFELIHVFSDKVERFSPNGVKDFYISYQASTGIRTIYDGESFIAKDIYLGAQPFDLQFALDRLSHNGKLEIYYAIGTGPQLYKVVVVDEDAILLRTFEHAKSVKIDKQPGMEDKLIVQYPDSTQVYGFLTPSTTVAEIQKNPQITVSPNPFSQTVEVQFSQSGDYFVRLTDIFGRFIMAQNVNNQEKATLTIPTDCSDGLYFLSVGCPGFQNCLKLVKGK